MLKNNKYYFSTCCSATPEVPAQHPDSWSGTLYPCQILSRKYVFSVVVLGGFMASWGGIWPSVKVGLVLGGFMAGLGRYLAKCEGGFGPGRVYGWLGVVFSPV
jgi:hypothetical protein